MQKWFKDVSNPLNIFDLMVYVKCRSPKEVYQDFYQTASRSEAPKESCTEKRPHRKMPSNLSESVREMFRSWRIFGESNPTFAVKSPYEDWLMEGKSDYKQKYQG